MHTLNSFSNHVGGLSTKAIEASAHRFHSITPRVAARYIPADPSKFFLSNPSLLSASRRNPHSTLATSMNYAKAPLSFQIQNISVGNQFSAEWINDFNNVSFQNEFGLNPEKVNKHAENYTNRQVARDLNVTVDNPDTVNREEGNQQIRSTGPSEVTAGSKGFIHHPSIAGERK